MTRHPTPEERRALRALAENADRGPWYVDTVQEDGITWNDVLGDDIRITGDLLRAEDAAHIAAANPTAVLALLDMIDAAEQIIDVARRHSIYGCECDTCIAVREYDAWRKP